MVQLSTFFITLLTATSLTATGTAFILRRTVAQVEADIAAICKTVTALDTSINNFPSSGGTLAQALPIHANAVATTGALKTATADTNANAVFSTSDANIILNDLTGCQTIIQDALTAIVGKKAALGALSVGNLPALVRQDLVSLQGNTSDFGNTLVNRVTNEIKPSVTSLLNKILKKIADALAAYS